MQGKENQEFDKEYVERQWSHMESLLEDRMPQAKKRDQKPLLLLLSLLLVLTTLSTVYYAYKFNTSIPVTDLIKEKIIYKNIYIETPAVAPISNISTKNSLVHKEAPASTINQSFSNSQNVSTAAGYLTTAVRNSGSDTGSNSASSSESNSLSYEGSDQIIVASKATRGISKTSSIRSLDNSNTLPSIEAKIKTTEFVESGLYFDNSSLILNKDKRRKTEFQVGILAASTMDWDYTGMGIETGVRFPIGKKLGFNTGIAVSYLDRDYLFIPDFIRGTDETLVDPKNPQTYYEGLRNLKQVYIPLSLNYDVTQSWAISSGFKFRYTYSETVNEDLPKPSPPGGPSRTPVESYESLFNKANLGLTAGLRFNINPNLSILLDSEWGMSSLINRSEFITTQSKYDLDIVNLITAYNF